jgi:transcriptional regulator GlxA family with amidase domain
MRIEIVVFDGFDELDALGPYEILTTAAPADWDVRLVGAAGAGVVRGAHGLRLVVEFGLGETGQPDAILVPGGGWVDRAEAGAWHEAQEGNLPRDIAELAPGCRWVASVCTGAMLLAAAGLTKGRPATTNRAAFDELRATGAEVHEEARVVDDGNLLTAAGITAGFDLACWIVERELGAEAADEVASTIEYARRGPIWRAVEH